MAIAGPARDRSYAFGFEHGLIDSGFSAVSYRFVVFVEMRLELGHSLIPALHVPLTHLRAEHARGSCGTSAARASQSGPQPTTQHGCMPASRRRLAGRLPGRSNPTAGGRHEPSMAPSGHEAIHAEPRRPTCRASPTYMRDVAPRHRSSSHQAVRPVRVAALARASI